MRLIDADALEKDAICLYSTCSFKPIKAYTQDQIGNAPTIDAVQVVRCGECKFWANDGKHIYGMCQNPNVGSVKMDTDFCSYGERR